MDVSNDKNREFFSQMKVDDKQIITYDDCDHDMLFDGEYLPFIIKDMVSWLDVRADFSKAQK